MINLNKNHSLNALQEIVKTNINRSLDYMPDSFNKQQRYALELFQKRIFLEETIDKSISFNKKLNWDNINQNLKLTTTAEELVKVFQLRSSIYTDIDYQDEFPDEIEGLNFDKYDPNSAIIYYQNNKEVTGTIRLIFDSKNKLPSESMFSFNDMRFKYDKIGEISRLMVKKENKGLNLEFKYLMAGVHNVFNNNEINMTLSGMKEEHFKFYSRFGGVEIVEYLDNYGSFNTPCIIMSWDLSQPSRFFKKAFLS